MFFLCFPVKQLISQAQKGGGREGGGDERKTEEGDWGGGKGRERKGMERKGKERKGKERKGKERKGKESPLNALPPTFQNCIICQWPVMSERIVFHGPTRLGQNKPSWNVFEILEG